MFLPQPSGPSRTAEKLDRHSPRRLETSQVENPPKPQRILLDSSANAAYALGASFLVLPADLQRPVAFCKAKVSDLTHQGGWLTLQEGKSFPAEEEVLLVEFCDREVVTHRTRILQRQADRVWVGLPSLTEREPSQLAPFTGRADYRVKVDLPVLVRICEGRATGNVQWPCRLRDVSRGGMSLTGPLNQPFEKGQKVDIRVVSWEYPVRLDTEIVRVWREGEEQRTALVFPERMSLHQRELISTFVLQVQRRDVLGRSLPANEDDPA